MSAINLLPFVSKLLLFPPFFALFCDSAAAVLNTSPLISPGSVLDFVRTHIFLQHTSKCKLLEGECVIYMFVSIFQMSKTGLDVTGVKKNCLNGLINERNSSLVFSKLLLSIF